VDSEGRYTRERERMVDEQLAGRGVTDPRVVAAMRRVPRHRFVQEALRTRAYGDHPLPIGEEQTISQPFIVGLMTSLLELSGREKVLEVGTGSGYQTAVLAALARRVCSIERLPRLAERARTILESLGHDNVWVRVGNGALGWPDEAPFDCIIVTAGGPAGQMTLIPLAALVLVTMGWRGVFIIAGVAALVLAPIALWALKAADQPVASGAGPTMRADLAYLLRSPVFHLLFWGFFLCGFTSIGVIETHFVSRTAQISPVV